MARWQWLDVDAFPTQPQAVDSGQDYAEQAWFVGIGDRLSGLRLSGSAYRALGHPDRLQIALNDDEDAMLMIPTDGEGLPIVGDHANKWVLLGREGTRRLLDWVRDRAELPGRHRRFAPEQTEYEGTQALVIRFTA